MKNKILPTQEEFVVMYHQKQRYYKLKYPEMNYKTSKEVRKITEKPTLEQFELLDRHKKTKWRNIYPGEYPAPRKYNKKKE